MKRILIYSVCEDIVALELAIDNIEKGNEVFLLECDHILKNCQHNRSGLRFMCGHCYHSMHNVIKKLKLDKKAKLLQLSKVITSDDLQEANNFKIDFDSVQELKDLRYKGAQLGYGAFSNYVSFSRNVMPNITEDFKNYIRHLIKKEIIVFNAIERLHNRLHFDQIVFHNGRFAQFKPFLEFAKINGIDYVATEVINDNGKILKDLFYNDIPQSIHYWANNIKRNWEMADPVERESIARSFFDKRRKGIPAGDKVYIKGQHSGEMPDDWNNEVENITIFNSSEDEFYAVSSDYDSYLLFPNQYEALKTLFEHYKNDETKHFYLRIHPNLTNVPYKSHRALYGLKYKNVTIIPPDSPISSYSLLDFSDKIIIFNSTIGVEAAYWGKPVISLSKFLYWELGFLYHPDTIDDIWPLVDNKILPVSYNDNVLKYAYWLLKKNYPAIEHIPYCFVGTFLGHVFNKPTIMKFLGSYKLNVLIKALYDRYVSSSKTSIYPSTEPYNISM